MKLKINLIAIVLLIMCVNSVYAQDEDLENTDYWSNNKTFATIDMLNPLNYVDRATELLSSRINQWIAQKIEDFKFDDSSTNILRIHGRLRSRWQEQSNYDFDDNNYDLQHFQNHFYRCGISAITTEFRIDFEFYKAIEIYSSRIFGEPDRDNWDIHRLTFMLTGFQDEPIRLEIPPIGQLLTKSIYVNMLFYIGRGPVTFGRGRLIGSNDWMNRGDVFDEVVLAFIADDFGTSLTFFGLRDVNYTQGTNKPDHDTQVLGVALIGVDPFDQRDNVSDVENKGLLRPGDYDFEFFPANNSNEQRNILGVDIYAIWVIHPDNDIPSELGRIGSYNIGNLGIRAGFELVSNWFFEFEGNYQTGEWGGSNMRAFAMHAELTGGFETYIPISFTGFVGYASGDSNPKDGVVETFYDIYGTANQRFGTIDLLGWRNLINMSFELRIQLAGKIMLKSSAHMFETAQSKDAIYGSSGSVLLARGVGEPFRSIGYALNSELQYHYSDRIYLYGGVSYFKPGTRLESVFLDDEAVQYYIISEIRY